MKVKWDTLHLKSKVEILSSACINTRFAICEWDEIETWIQRIIQDNVKLRSKGKVLIGGES